ncbi:MAG: DMT family transporter [Fimbriimonadaceae bacterium]|nr:DMT family transporter [Alphaproteobacteria bacterium]
MAIATETSPDQSKAMLGIGLLLMSIVVFTTQDTITKHLAQNYPVPFFLMIRYWAFALFATALAQRSSGSLITASRSKRPLFQILRALILVAEMGIFAWGLRFLKLADAHSIFAVYPLMTTALAVPFLGERIGWRRWLAVVIGFLGVLIILRPGLSVFQPASIIPLIGALGFAFYAILTRIVSHHDPFSTTLFFTAVFGAIAISAIGPFYMASPTLADWGWIGLLCLTGIAGHYMLIKALEFTPASTLQPFNYLLIVGAAIMGFLVFGEIPDFYTIVGAAIIVSSGLFVAWREQVREKKQRILRASETASSGA